MYFEYTVSSTFMDIGEPDIEWFYIVSSRDFIYSDLYC